MRWPAPAKLNLFLHIVGRRHDGYHLLQTWFQFIDWCDWLEFEVIDENHIERVNNVAGVAESDDLVIRAARLLQDATNAPAAQPTVHGDILLYLDPHGRWAGRR